MGSPSQLVGHGAARPGPGSRSSTGRSAATGHACFAALIPRSCRRAPSRPQRRRPPKRRKPQQPAPPASKAAATKLPAARPAPAPAAPQTAAPNLAKSEPAPIPTATAPPSHPAPTPAFDPRKLDPNTNAKLKIELNHLPLGVPYTVEMNSKVYLRGITGEDADLDNLFVPPGVQEFRVTMRSGGQQRVSNIVSEDFKAKKRKTLKIELLGQSSAPAKSAEPLSGDAKIFLSLRVIASAAREKYCNSIVTFIR